MSSAPVNSQTTDRHRRRHTGVVLFRNAFRPFFLGAGIWAIAALSIRLAELSGIDISALAFADLNRWHVHELLFGYGSGVVAGFALTAIPNWTGRLPVAGTALAALTCLWLAGRVAALLPQLPSALHLVIDAAFLPTLAGLAAREIVAAKNHRNIPVVGLIALLALGNISFHLEEAEIMAVTSYGARLGLAALILLMGLIGGRIVPSFTNNWLARENKPRIAATNVPTERLVHGATAAALALWVVLPFEAATGAALAAAAAAQLIRLARWRGWMTVREPLVLVLHVGYAWIPIGLALLGATIVWHPGAISAGVHALTVGAVGTMTLAVMTRATLGHTGRALRAGGGTTAIYAAITISALARVAAAFLPAAAGTLLPLAGLFWISSFVLFVAIFGAMHLRPRAGETA
ncbi:MAG: NnrS family protein [Alphaproteobacteria bacterium]|nr:NnrS family protein [Alphaproteobacteria bacterium]